MPGAAAPPRAALVFAGGAAVGALGGLIGLGGAEFRLPLLLMFGFAALPAIVLNKATSLVVVLTALLFRSAAVAPAAVAAQWPVIVNLLAGSLLGAWLAAGWATRRSDRALHRVMAVLLVGIALALWLGHSPHASGPALAGGVLVLAGLAAGFAIGVVASLLGVAGGELLIPTLVLLYGLDLELAGSVSLAISLPTMLAGFARYRGDRSFEVLRRHRGFVALLAAGSIAGAMLGALAVGWVDDRWLLPTLVAVLLASAWKAWTHGRAPVG